MTDGFQPEYVDEPTCRICGVALADHPKVSELCRTVFTLAAKVQRIVAYETCTGEIECTCWVCLSERVKRQKQELKQLSNERNALKDACHKNKRKWRHGWKRTLDEIVRGWKRACGEKDAEIERLTAERDRLKAAIVKMSHRRCHDCGHVAYYLDATIPECNCEVCGSSDTRRVKEATDG